MTRIAVVQQGDPSDPGSWSGVPARLSRGLEAAGCEVVPIGAEFRGAARLAGLLRMSWADESANRFFALACSATGSRGVRRAGDLDGIVTIGSGYTLRTDVPIVTFEDMTVVQALALGEPPYDGLSEAGASRWRARQRRIYERSRGCCVASSWAAASVRADYGIPAAKVHVVGFGHNVEVEPGERDWSAPRFLLVASDWRRKRGDAVVAAFASVRERHPEATLDLVGRHPQIDAPGVRGHGVLPLGTEQGQRSYRERLRAATCYVMPSASEPFGIAYIDAARAGIPSIGTTVGGAAGAIGEGGRVVGPDDPQALREAMLELSDPDTARACGERAREHAAKLTWPLVAQRLLRALRPPGVELEGLAQFLDDDHTTARAG